MQETPKIVLVIGSLGAGGAERAVTDMANYWVGKNWRVLVVTLTACNKGDAYPLSPEIERLSLDTPVPVWLRYGKLSGAISKLLQLRKIMRQADPDAVLSFIHVTNIITILSTLFLDMNVVVSERGAPDKSSANYRSSWGYPLPRHWRFLRRRLYRRANLVTALNMETANWLQSECRVDVKIVPVALRHLPEENLDREHIILGVGRLHQVKGFDLLLEAFARIYPAFPTWRVVFIGDGPEQGPLRELCSKLDIADRVDFLGHLKGVETWMARAGIIVLPSRSEAFGNAILESLAMGAPVISTHCSGPSSIIDDGVNGRLVAIDDHIALSEAMRELLSDPELRRRLGQEALNVRRRFAQDRIMAMWEDCIFPG